MALFNGIKQVFQAGKSVARAISHKIVRKDRPLRPRNEYLESIIGKEFPILDHGFMRIVDYMGDDSSIVQAARVSYGAGTTSVRSDTNLIRYLMRHKHWSPFEMCTLKYHVKLPIFVARQWIRHVGSLNEYSARYSVLSNENYIPELERLAKQSTKNKQGSGEAFSPEEAKLIQDKIHEVYEFAEGVYKDLNDRGLSREIGRIIKATGGYTQWYWSTNLRDLLHFCRQRCDSHAQYEIRAYADVLRDEVIQHWVPATYGAYIDYIQNAVELSGPAQIFIFDYVTAGMYSDEPPKYLSKREWKEAKAWCDFRLEQSIGNKRKQTASTIYRAMDGITDAVGDVSVEKVSKAIDKI